MHITSLKLAIIIIFAFTSMAVIPCSLVNAEENSTLKIVEKTTGSEGFDLFKGLNVQRSLGWIPKADLENPLPKECHPKTLEQQLSYSVDQSEFHKMLNTYFKKCSSLISKDQPKSLDAILKITSNKYEGYKQKTVKKVEINVNGKGTVFGYLAIKDNTPRPFVIFKCGIFCQGDFSSGNRMIFMHLFDEAPFNVLMIGSQTGMNNLKRNKRLIFGGFFEGQEIFDIAKWLRTESEFKHLITDLHVFGMSLGGNAALFSSLYNSVQKLQRGQTIIDSAIAYCPAIDMKSTIENAFKHPILKYTLGPVTWNSMRQVRQDIPELKELIPNMILYPPFDDYPFLIGESTRRYLDNRFKFQFLAPFRGVQLRKLNTYWEHTNFLKFTNYLETKTLIFSSLNDPIVKNKHNAKKLLNKQTEFLNIVSLDYGSHCAQSISYGWQNMSTIIKSYFLQNSSVFNKNYVTKIKPMDFPGFNLKTGAVHTDQTWTLQSNKDYAILEYRYFDPSNNSFDCREPSSAFGLPLSCYSKKSKRVKLKDLPFSIRKPATVTEAEAMTRWFNSNVELLTKDKQLMVDTPLFGQYIRWKQINTTSLK